MRHLSEEDQVLACYTEVLPRESIVHLSTCAECQAAVASLKRVLGAADNDSPPEPDASFEDRVWSRIRWQIQRRPSSMRRWLASTAAAAAILAIAYGGLRVYRASEAGPGEQAIGGVPHRAPEAAEEPRDGQAMALEAAARDQLDRSTRFLVDVAHEDADRADVPTLRSRAGQLVTNSRLLRASSSKGGRDEVSQLLAFIEPVLLELAHGPEEMPREELAEIQGRIEARQLLFKLRVVSSTLQDSRDRQYRGAAPSSAAKL